MKEQVVDIAPGEELEMLSTDEERRVLALVITALNNADSNASARRILGVIDLIYGRVPQSAEIPVTIEECDDPETDGPADSEVKVAQPEPDERDCKNPQDRSPSPSRSGWGS